jgi:putative ABC transport system permease protein
MTNLRTFIARLRGIFGTARSEKELNSEVCAHLDALTEENILRGMTPEEARYAARREFGGVEQIKEDYREARGLPMLELFVQDLRYALRALRKNPGFAAIAVLTLALGIGANTAIFSIVNAVLLRPLPFPEANRIVAVYQTLERNGVHRNGASYLNFADWQKESHSFEHMGAYHGSDVTLTGVGDPEIIPGAVVTSGLLSTLGARPVAGRLLIPEDDRPGAAAVVVLSERLWRRRFGAAADLVGKTVTLDKQVFTVAGILPGDFQFPFENPPADLWIPVQQDTQLRNLIPRRGGHYLSAIARLRPGVTLGEAETELAGINGRLSKQYPAENGGWGIRIAPLQHELVGDVQLGLLVLLSAVALVLLIACANVANLLLARATSRSRELAVRAALGAGRKRIVRQLLTESLLLGGMGGAAGAATAWWAVRGLSKLLPDDLPRIHAIQVDGWVLGFALLLSVLVSLVFGLAPAIHATSVNLVEGLKEGARGNPEGSGKRLRAVLIVGEVALAVVLLTGAGLLVRSFLELQSVSPGFRVNGILTATVVLPQSQYTKPEEWARYSGQAIERIRTIPGVTGASVVMGLPMSGSRVNLAFAIDGKPQAPEDRVSANYASVSRGYFQLFGIPLLRGRVFDERDTAASQKIAIVSEAFTRRYFPNEEAIGKHVSFGFPEQASREIVGVVGDVRQVSLDAAAEPEMYAPFEQSPVWAMNFAVRTAGDPAALASAVRERIQEGDKDLPVVDVQPMTVYLRDSMAQPLFRTLLFGLFGVVALVLAAVGIYGVISYTVAQRTQEIGLRMALGAAPAQVLGLVVGQGMKLVLVGLAAGMAGAFGLTRLFSSLLFGITPGDPLTYFGTVLVLMLVSLLACYIPAKRAMSVDPLVALRYE